MSELKPCPFCGGQCKEVMRFFSDDGKFLGYGVICAICGALGPSGQTASEAIATWTRRPLEDELAAALKGLLEHHGTPARWAAAKDALAKTREEGKE